MKAQKVRVERVNGKSGILIGTSFLMLLFLRFGILTAVGSFSKPAWLSPTFEIGTYCFTVLLIWLERKELRKFFIDELTLILLLTLKPLESIILLRSASFLSIRQPGGMMVAAVSLSLAVVYGLKRSEFDVDKADLRSLRFIVLGVLIGLSLSIVLSIPMSFQVDRSGLPYSVRNLVSISAILGIFYQAGYAAVSEEPLFRGFLCGYLIMKGLKPWTVIILQALLFSLGHVYYLTTYPLSFFIIVPVSALVLGIAAVKTRTINTSIAVHGTLNGLGYQMGLVFASIRASI